MEISEFGVGRPDFGGRRPRGEALGKKKRLRGSGGPQDSRGLGERLERALRLDDHEVRRDLNGWRFSNSQV